MEIILAAFSFILFALIGTKVNGDESVLDKNVYVVMLARNKEHTLPYFLELFEKLNYPKNKLSLSINSDHNEDNTNEILLHWVSKNKPLYESVTLEVREQPTKYIEEDNGPEESWVYERNMNLIFMKENALHLARKANADYIWYLDLDAFLTRPDTLQILIEKKKVVVAPMLQTTKAYSNFWGDMTETYWYKRSEDYMSIVNFQKIGCFPVALVSESVLIDLKDEKSNLLSFYKYKIPFCEISDVPSIDIITFALNAQKNSIEMHVCNDYEYGFTLIPDQTKQKDIQEIQYIQKIMKEVTDPIGEMMKYEPETEPEPSQPSQHIPTKEKTKTSKKTSYLNDKFDKIYCLTLSTRPEGKQHMMEMFANQGITPTFIDAIDRTDYNKSKLETDSLRKLRVYDGKLMTNKVVRNFLSHYLIWKDVIENDYKQVIIFEDDVNLLKTFKSGMSTAMAELKALKLDWEFVYLGRQPITPHMEKAVPGSTRLVTPSYSYGTRGYMLSQEGATKLVGAKPLFKILPLDEYIPIMFDAHPKTLWKKHYDNRNLKAFALDPSLVEPLFMDEGELSTEEHNYANQLEQVFEFWRYTVSAMKINLHLTKTEL